MPRKRKPVVRKHEAPRGQRQRRTVAVLTKPIQVRTSEGIKTWEVALTAEEYEEMQKGAHHGQATTP